jgi:phospholipid N-methyltransferase
MMPRMPGAHSPKFLLEYIRKPTTVGSLVPSSDSLAQEMVRGLEMPSRGAVIEYGAGTGAFTPRILQKLPGDCRFIMLEVNPPFVQILRRRFPGQAIYQESVVNVRAVCDREGISHVDAVISGLPWASFTVRQQDEYLQAMMTVLKPGGQFVTFAYLPALLLPAARRFRQHLSGYFREIRLSRSVWANVPPALVYRCRR